MSESPAVPPRPSVFDRMRGAITLLMIALGGFVLYYSLFFQRKTAYYSGRNARLVGRLAQQIRRSIDSTARVVTNAASVPDNELEGMYRFGSALSEEQRPPQAVFSKIAAVRTDKESPASRSAQRRSDGLLLRFNSQSEKTGENAHRFISAEVPLQRLIQNIVRQTANDIFDTAFILDSAGNVIYQSARRSEDESDAQITIVRLTELTAPRRFDKPVTLKVGDLMSASRQMPVRIGDASYQLFSVPLVSGIEGAKSGEYETWVVCGVVSNATFRSNSLAISVTLMAALGGIVLLMIASWPFMKMGLTSAVHKVTLADVILLGISGIFAVCIVTMALLDWFTYRKLERLGDEELIRLGRNIESNFQAETHKSIQQLDAAQRFAEARVAEARLQGKEPVQRNGNLLLDRRFPLHTFFQSFSLIGPDGWQRVKWFVDAQPTPVVRVSYRSYFAAPLNRGREYLELGDRHLTIESIHSSTTGQAEAAFSRRTDDMPGTDPAFAAQYPVIALTATPLSVTDPVLPEGFGFAVIDPSGKVLFHSKSERNMVENFFAETDENPEVRSAVAARQNKLIDIRYWGDDYRAFAHPMTSPKWTLITFREQSALRTLNTGALIIALIFLLALFVGGLLPFIAAVLLARPRYRADWLWPDPGRVAAYVELAGVYLALLLIGALLVLGLRGAPLAAFPFWFLPLVLLITYLYLGGELRGAKRVFFIAAPAVCTASLLVLSWNSWTGLNVPLLGAAILLLAVSTRAVLRKRDPDKAPERLRERQTALPLCYVSAAFLLLLVTAVVPTAAFFRAAYQLQLVSSVKSAQMKLAGDLHDRWWHVFGEFNPTRGKGKAGYFDARWGELLDVYSFNKPLEFKVEGKARIDGPSTTGFPAFIEAILPSFSEASVNARQLAADDTADHAWWWERKGREITLKMKSGPKHFTIRTDVPSLLPSPQELQTARALGAIAFATLVIVIVSFAIARFIARRVFLVDLVNPLWLSQGFLGLKRVIAFPCDDAAAARLFRNGFRQIDLRNDADLEVARGAPQSFQGFESAVFIDGLGYPFASGEKAELARTLIDRLTRNSDRIVVIRPTGLTVITTSFLQGEDGDAWAKTLSNFVWVNGSQLNASARRLTLSTPPPMEDRESAELTARTRWRRRSLHGLYVLSGFDAYFEQFTDTRRTIEKTIAAETAADPYLETIISGLDTHATGRDQVLEEIGERAEEYYEGLWHTCTPNEQLVMMQLARTGLVNGKARKDVRRLLARGLVRRDPQLRIMNETFRRFVLAHSETSTLARQLEHDLGGDAWSRLRVPFFAAVVVVLLFFFTTQRQMFDTTIAVVSGLVATLPAFMKMLSGFGEKGAR